MNKILIVEDEKDINNILSKVINENGYKAVPSYDGIDACKKIKNDKFDLVLLDIMLPYKSGDEILKEIRRVSDIPVIIISAKSLVEVKVDMLRCGADDYITKPFDLKEVIARIETNLRRYKKSENKSEIYSFKNLSLNTETKEVKVKEKIIECTAKEYNILELFLKNTGKVYSKSVLYKTVWESEYIGDDKTIKTHISNLRNKLSEADSEEVYIETVWGLGYKMGHK